MRFPSMTVREVRDYIQENAKAGVTCPCCDQFVKIYCRRFNSGMAKTLAWLVNVSGKHRDFVSLRNDAPRYVLTNREHGRLRAWKVAVPLDTSSTRTKDSGWWQPTLLGRRFIRGKEKIPAAMFFLRNEVVGASDDLVSVYDVLGIRFDYRRLLSE